jgi:SulP family sulfate permease
VTAALTPRPGDAWGALAATLVALPSSVAYGVVVFSAVSPAHAGAGAAAGAIGAGTLGLVTSVVGRNGGFVAAPCAPAAAVLSGLAASLVASGVAPARALVVLTLAGLGAAGLQVGFGLARLGRLIKYIPYQVVSGYLSGVAVIVAVAQLPRLLGMPSGTHLGEALTHPAEWRWPGIVVGLVTIAVMGLSPPTVFRIPASILALGAGVGTYLLLGFVEPSLWAVVDNPLVVGPLGSGGSLADGLRAHLGALATASPGDVSLAAAAAGTLAVLLSIDTLKTGVVLDTLTRRRHDSNRELVAQGLGNAVTSLLGGVPGAGTMGPTLVNVTAGGRTPWSGFGVALASLLAFLTLGDALAWVPIGALAGLLLVVAWRMFDWSSLRLARNPETRLDFAVIVGVVATAEGVGLIEASVLGVALSILLFIRDQIRSDVALHRQDLTVLRSKRRRAGADVILDREGGRALVFDLQGNLFFGTTDQLYAEVQPELDRVRFVLLDCRRVHSLDYTAGHLLHLLQDQLRDHGGQLLLCRVASGVAEGQDIGRYLETLGLLGERGVKVFPSRNDALEWMEDELLAESGWSQRPSERALALGELPLLGGLAPDLLAALASITGERSLPAGADLFRQGDPGDELFFVRRGLIDAFLPLPSGAPHPVGSFGPGDVFGEIAFLDGRPRTAVARARVETELYAISRARFDALLATHQALASAVLGRLATALAARLRRTDAELRTIQGR